MKPGPSETWAFTSLMGSKTENQIPLQIKVKLIIRQLEPWPHPVSAPSLPWLTVYSCRAGLLKPSGFNSFLPIPGKPNLWCRTGLCKAGCAQACPHAPVPHRAAGRPLGLWLISLTSPAWSPVMVSAYPAQKPKWPQEGCAHSIPFLLHPSRAMLPQPQGLCSMQPPEPGGL